MAPFQLKNFAAIQSHIEGKNELRPTKAGYVYLRTRCPSKLSWRMCKLQTDKSFFCFFFVKICLKDNCIRQGRVSIAST